VGLEGGGTSELLMLRFRPRTKRRERRMRRGGGLKIPGIRQTGLRCESSRKCQK